MAKVRFAALQSGVEKQLFSVEEHAGGDLTFGLPNYDTLRFGGRRLPSPKSRKLSVHRSTRSLPPAHTITHEIKFEDGRFHKGHALAKRRNAGPFIWPLFCVAVGKAAKSLETKSSVAKDDICRLAAYDAGLDTLMMGVFVSDADFEFPPAYGLSIVSRRFSFFRVSVIYNFATIPSPMNCFENFVYTSTVTGAGPIVLPGRRISAYGQMIEAVEPFLIKNLVPMANMIRQRRSSIMMLKNAADVQMVRFPRNPSEGFSKTELRYGENPIFGARRNAFGRRMGRVDFLTRRMFATQPAGRELGQYTMRRD
jgi:hypothetical protein